VATTDLKDPFLRWPTFLVVLREECHPCFAGDEITGISLEPGEVASTELKANL
jgi:hypothetical protein